MNATKAKRAVDAVHGKSKVLSVERDLVAKFRTEKPKITNEELYLEVYKGMYGLIDVVRAAKNRENEAKERKRKRSV